MFMGHIAHNLRHIYTRCSDSNTAAASPICFQCIGGKLSLHMPAVRRRIHTMLQALFRRRTFAIAASIVAALVIVGAIVGAIYVFGAGARNPAATGSGTVTAPTLTASGDTTIFAIDSSSSQATFTIDEILFGKPNTVVGQTSQVAGQIAINTKDPSQSKIGEIKVDVSALTTDDPLRNQTLRGRILETDDPSNQFATF